MHYDVAIIGAGEAGVFAGYELMKLRPELSVLVLEQGAVRVPQAALNRRRTLWRRQRGTGPVVGAADVPVSWEGTVLHGKTRQLAKYNELYLQNEDMVGWISIAGTKLNYPVMQTPNNPNFYLKHNFEKAYSDLGTPYIQENCNLSESDNLVIYGHHIKGGKMFGALEDYKAKSFYEKHKTIQFDTLTEQGEYEIVAVFKTVAYSSEGFRYYDFVDAENEEAFDAYVAKCKELSLYDTGVSAAYGDRLITLSTCEYSAQNGRLVVVAKKVS